MLDNPVAADDLNLLDVACNRVDLPAKVPLGNKDLVNCGRVGCTLVLTR